MELAISGKDGQMRRSYKVPITRAQRKPEEMHWNHQRFKITWLHCHKFLFCFINSTCAGRIPQTKFSNNTTTLLDFSDKILQRHYRALDFANDNKCSESIWVLTKLSEGEKSSEKCSHKIEFQQIISGRNKHLICREETVFCFLVFWFFFFRLPFQWLACTLRDLKSSGNAIFLSAFIRLTQNVHQQDVVHLIQVHASRDEFYMKNPISKVWFRHLKPIKASQCLTWR